jgi:hypothetical protein
MPTSHDLLPRIDTKRETCTKSQQNTPENARKHMEKVCDC